MIKELIKQRFSKSLETYQQNAIVQKNMAQKLVQLLDIYSFKNILELGCGTGFVTEMIVQKCEFDTYDAIDIVEECGKYINQISSDINFYTSDIERLDLNKKYDLIISNASLQWLENSEGFLLNIKNHLTQDGIFAFTMFGNNNFKEFHTIISSTPYYCSIDELQHILKNYEIIHLSEDVIEKYFDTPKDVLQHIKLTGVNAISQEHWTKSDLINFENKYFEICNNEIKLTYNPIYVIVKNN